MLSHSFGEVWGLSLAGDHVITTGDDNKVMVWDSGLRKCISANKISKDNKRIKKEMELDLT